MRNPDFSVIGSPMLARAMGSWQTALCSARSPVFIQYDSAQNEPLAREDFVAGTDTVALTTLPLTGAKGPQAIYLRAGRHLGGVGRILDR